MVLQQRCIRLVLVKYGCGMSSIIGLSCNFRMSVHIRENNLCSLLFAGCFCCMLKLKNVRILHILVKPNGHHKNLICPHLRWISVNAITEKGMVNLYI